MEASLIMNKINENRLGYKKTKYGWIPVDWECYHAAKSIKRGIRKGYTGLPLYAVTQRNGLVKRETIDRKVDSKLQEKDCLLIKKNSLAYNMMRMWQGAIGIATEDCVVSPAYIALNPEHDLNPIFFYYLCKTPRYLYLLKAFSYGLTEDRLRLYYKDFSLLPLPQPIILEQKKIVEMLSTWDQAIEKLEQLIELKEQRKKGLMQQLLTGKKRLPGFGKSVKEDGEIPEGWRKFRLDEVAELGRGRVISKDEIEKNRGIYPVYSSQTKNNGIFGKLNSYDFDEELITWTTDGVNAGTIFLRKGKFNCTNVCGTIQKKANNFDYAFLAYQLSTITYKYVSHSLANPKLMNTEMKTVRIILPEIDEQLSISNIFINCDNEIQRLIKWESALKIQKKGLMQKLLTGEVRVKL